MRSIVSSTIQLAPMPDNIGQVRHRIYFSNELNGYLEEFNGSVTFSGDSYNNLRELFVAGGAPTVDVVLDDHSGSQYPAVIVVNDCEWNPLKRTVQAEFVDGGYLSLIDINAEIDVTLNVPKTKSGLTMPTYITTGLQYVLPDGTLWVSNRVGVTVYDALKTIVAFMSDNKLTVVSDYFESLTNYHPVLISGKELRLGGGDIAPQDGAFFAKISFADLFADLSKHFNLRFSPESPTSIRIEPTQTFQSETGGIAIPHADENQIKQTTIESTFYAKLLFGGDVESMYTYFPDVQFIGFNRESYHVQGQGNKRASLDLQTNTIIVDTNIIQTVINDGATVQTDTSRDKDVFMIWHYVDSKLPVLTVNPISSTDYYYNEFSTNQAVANRWFGSVPFSVWSYFGFGNNEASAVQETQFTPAYWGAGVWNIAILTFANITVPPSFDPNTNLLQVVGGGPWDVLFFPIPTIVTSTYSGDATFYVVPVSGVYTVSLDMTVQAFNPTLYQCYCAVYDSLDNLQRFYPYDAPTQETFATPIRYRYNQSITIAATAAERLCIVFFAPDPTTIINPNGAHLSSFTVEDTYNVTKTYDEDEAAMITTSLVVDTPDDRWNDFRAFPHKKISINVPDGTISGYVRNFDRNPETGESKVEIDSKIRDIFK